MTNTDVRPDSDPRASRKAYVQESETSGWDIRMAHQGGQVVAHCEDWHRLERALARLGASECVFDRRTSRD
jgi:hypothetical protein